MFINIFLIHIVKYCNFQRVIFKNCFFFRFSNTIILKTMPKIKTTGGKSRSNPMGGKKPNDHGRRQALGDEIENDANNKDIRRTPLWDKKAKLKQKNADLEDYNDAMGESKNVLDKQMSKKLLESVEAQQREDAEEEEALFRAKGIKMTGAREENASKIPLTSSLSALYNGASDNAFGSVEELIDDDSALIDADGCIDIECSPEEEAAMQMFQPETKYEEKKTINLADIVTAAIKEKTNKAAAANEANVANMEEHGAELSPKVIEVYTRIGSWLKHYKAGDLPKPFKVVPSLVNWEEVLCLTNPLDWSPNAVAKATSMFASQLNAKMAQRFYNLVLLPAVRNDMARNKKMNYHY